MADYPVGGERWTTAEIEYLRANYRKVDTYALAEAMGRSAQAMRSMARRLGFAGVRGTPKPQRSLSDIRRQQTQRAEQYLAARAQGMTTAEVAARFGTTKGTVIGVINRYMKRVQA